MTLLLSNYIFLCFCNICKNYLKLFLGWIKNTMFLLYCYSIVKVKCILTHLIPNKSYITLTLLHTVNYLSVTFFAQDRLKKFTHNTVYARNFLPGSSKMRFFQDLNMYSKWSCSFMPNRKSYFGSQIMNLSLIYSTFTYPYNFINPVLLDLTFTGPHHQPIFYIYFTLRPICNPLTKKKQGMFNRFIN